MHTAALEEPGSFERSRLDTADFDGTMFETFEQAPALGIYGIDEAYRIAIERTLFFDKDALRKYADQGEHNNRTPLEIVNALVPNCTDEGLEFLTAALVKAKLDILENQIGKTLGEDSTWPRPLPGFIEYSQAVEAEKAEGIVAVRAVISSGHATFIRKCMALYGLEPPDIVITEETIRGLSSPLSPEKLTKPSVMPLLLAKLQWLAMYDLEAVRDLNSPPINDRITMIGDSKEKDGGLAQNAGVRFVHITAENAAEAWASMRTLRGLGSAAVGGNGR